MNADEDGSLVPESLPFLTLKCSHHCSDSELALTQTSEMMLCFHCMKKAAGSTWSFVVHIQGLKVAVEEGSAWVCFSPSSFGRWGCLLVVLELSTAKMKL